MFSDFHSHFSYEKILFSTKYNQKICVSLISQSDFNDFAKSQFVNNKNIKISFGCHPWHLDFTLVEFLKKQIDEKKVHGIGEFGFDFIKGDFSKNVKMQEEIFLTQCEIAIKHDLPMIFHGVKAFYHFAKYVDMLKKAKACVFHGYSGTYDEAMFFLKKNVNAYFSFGCGLLKNYKKALENISKLPTSVLGLETDDFVEKNGLEKIYLRASELRKINNEEKFVLFCKDLESNFDSIFTQS